ncbi:MAG: DUF190 domain-containing protein [Phycisphaerales bacterium]|nr:MAG: DUF190 domain-containing protein [Phycisphaerales bacterium]
MATFDNALRLRVYLGETDKHDGKPLYEAIVFAAREEGLAGATVLRGPMGFGRDSRIRTSKILRLSEDLPVVVEIIDAREAIEAFVDTLTPMLHSGLITLDDVQALRPD